MKLAPCLFTGLVIGLLFASTGVQPALSQPARQRGAVATWPPAEAARSSFASSTPAPAQSLGQLPLYFVENRGQIDPQVGYYVLGGGTAVYFTRQGVTMVLSSSEESTESATAAPGRPAGTAGGEQSRVRQRWAVKLDFLGANPQARPVGQEPTGAKVSYFKGPADAWQARLPTFGQVVYPELWPGIDLVYSGRAGHLKYEFRVKPGADPAQIRLGYRGTNGLSSKAGGQLAVSTPLGELVDEAPLAWQEIGGRRVPVEVGYELPITEPNRPGMSAESAATYGFRVGAYDRTQSLVLDPVLLAYCGYIGGSGDDGGNGIAVDAAGNAYVTGRTTSGEDTFPVKAGPDPTANGGYDAFVAKVNAAGTALLYAGYIGGAGDDEGHSIAVDAAGNAYITGSTTSGETTFPVKAGPDPNYNGGRWDAFVAKVNPAGTALLYAGYVGGSGDDVGNGIAVDAAGNGYITGYTTSDEDTFPVTAGPDPTFNGSSDAFVAKMNPAGTALLYAGYIGGEFADGGRGIALDTAGNAYITGDTFSSEKSFPVKIGPVPTSSGDSDAFVAKVNAAGTALLYAGFIGGSGYDGGQGIAVDNADNAYVTGWTSSTEAGFPEKGGPDLSFNGGQDAFVAKVNGAGTALLYAGYIGGSNYDQGYGIAVDDVGSAYVTGWTRSSDGTFPVIDWPDLTYNGSLTDGFVAKVNPAGSALLYAGYIGGSGDDEGHGIAVDDVGSAYVTGWTRSTEDTFPVTGGPDVTFDRGWGHAFVAKVGTPHRAFLPAIFRSLPPPHLKPIAPPGSTLSYKVTWNAVSGATGYTLEEAADPGFGTTRVIYAGSGTSHTVVSQGIWRYYRVRASNTKGSSPWSNVVAVDVRWEEEPNDDYLDATGPLASGVTYYGLPNDGGHPGDSEHRDYFMFDTAGGEIDVDLSNLTGSTRALQVYQGEPKVGEYLCQDLAGRECHVKNGKPGRYYIHVYSIEGTARVYSLTATFP